jgi:hypothetical protein
MHFPDHERTDGLITSGNGPHLKALQFQERGQRAPRRFGRALGLIRGQVWQVIGCKFWQTFPQPQSQKVLRDPDDRVSFRCEEPSTNSSSLRPPRE